MAQKQPGTSLAWRIVRSTIALVIMLAAFVASAGLDMLAPTLHRYALPIRVAIAVVALIAGVVAIRGWLGLIFQAVDRQAGLVLRNLGSWALYACLVLALLSLLGVDLSGLLVGGAILGVIVGAAAQSSLGNFFAGIMLMLARPFAVGVTLRVRTSIAGTVEFEGTVLDTNALFTTLRTPKGELLRLPNQVVMNSALTVGKPPLQASLQATVPAALSLAALRSNIAEQLGDRTAQVTVTPTTVAATGDPGTATVACQIEARSRKPIDPSTFAAAVTAALGSGGIEPEGDAAARATPSEPA
ncbi:MAG: mechanosensitive ion channel family protein [Candidatus Dormibacteraceae bacterium]